jgi:hypothetical protein
MSLTITTSARAALSRGGGPTGSWLGSGIRYWWLRARQLPSARCQSACEQEQVKAVAGNHLDRMPNASEQPPLGGLCICARRHLRQLDHRRDLALHLHLEVAARLARFDQQPLDQPERDLQRLFARGPGLSRIWPAQVTGVQLANRCKGANSQRKVVPLNSVVKATSGDCLRHYLNLRQSPAGLTCWPKRCVYLGGPLFAKGN